MKEKIALSIILIFTIVEANSQNFDNKIHERRKAFINQFIANYKTAFASMDLEYIEAIFSNDAIIITETNVIRDSKEENENKLRFKLKDKNRYKRMIENKTQYLNRLTKIFKDNIALNLSVANVKIYPHKDYNEIYGLSFLQSWKAKDNSALLLEDDTPGYIFMMIDFKTGENTPTIHIRTWQPESHIKQNNDIYHLYDFIIL